MTPEWRLWKRRKRKDDEREVEKSLDVSSRRVAFQPDERSASRILHHHHPEERSTLLSVEESAACLRADSAAVVAEERRSLLRRRRRWGGMGAWTAAILLLLLLLPIHARAACILEGECKSGPMTALANYSIPCALSAPVPPRHLDSASAHKLRYFCPHLFDTKRPLTDAEVCCDSGQVVNLLSQLELAANIFGSCKICMLNFFRFWCDFMCSPHQADFVRVTKTARDDDGGEGAHREYVDTIEYHMSRQFVDRALKSCRKVSFTGAPALGMACGLPNYCDRAWNSTCVETCLSKLGRKDISQRIPLNTDFRLHDEKVGFPPGIRPLQRAVDALECNSPPPHLTMDACSCSECIESCPAGDGAPGWLKPFLFEHAKEAIETSDSVEAATRVPSLNGSEAPDSEPTAQSIGPATGFLERKCILGYSCLYVYAYCLLSTLLFFVLVCLLYFQRCSEKRRQEDVKAPIVYASEYWGARDWLDDMQQKLSSWYANLVIEHSYRVVSTASAIVFVLILGMLRIHFVSDPIEVWTSPDSRARIEKHYFDNTFGEFPRYSQVILTPSAEIAPFEYGGEQFGAAFRLKFMLHSFRLIERILGVTHKRTVNGTDEDIRLEDVCFKPFGEEKGCFLQSPFGFFQNNMSTVRRSLRMERDELAAEWSEYWRERGNRGGGGERAEMQRETDRDETSTLEAVQERGGNETEQETVRIVKLDENSTETRGEMLFGWMHKLSKVVFNGVKKGHTRPTATSPSTTSSSSSSSSTSTTSTTVAPKRTEATPGQGNRGHHVKKSEEPQPVAKESVRQRRQVAQEDDDFDDIFGSDGWKGSPESEEETGENGMPLMDELQSRRERLRDAWGPLGQLKKCISNPLYESPDGAFSCIGPYGGPQLPDIIFGGFAPHQIKEAGKPQRSEGDSEGGGHVSAKQILRYSRDHLVTVMLDPKKAADAELWESSFLDMMKSFQSDELSVVFISSRSVRDEIDRAGMTDVNIAVIGQLLMNSYFVVNLAQHTRGSNSPFAMLVTSKILVGITGASAVLLAVLVVMGFYAWINVQPTLMCLEVQPFLICAIGVNNIFHFVKTYQRLSLTATPGGEESRRERIATTCAQVLPSMFASALTECICFLTVGLSRIPALQVFSLYASLGVAANFALTLTIFIPVFVRDSEREEDGKYDLLFCCKHRHEFRELRHEKGFFHRLFENYIAPAVTSDVVRYSALIIQFLLIVTAFGLAPYLSVGLDEKMSVPEDSYVRKFMETMPHALAQGLPVHFVVRGRLDYADAKTQRMFCTSEGCSEQSLGAMINAAIEKTDGLILQPSLSWLDDYARWLRPAASSDGVSCCRMRVHRPGEYCSEYERNVLCVPCVSTNRSTVYEAFTPTRDDFYEHLRHFSRVMPTDKCPANGQLAHYGSVRMGEDNRSIDAMHLMAFHATYMTSEGYIDGLRLTRLIAEESTRALRANGLEAEVFPYSYYYVYYDQYLSIGFGTASQLMLSISMGFITLFVALVSLCSAGIIIANTMSSTIMIIAYMVIMGIELNGLTIVNLAMSLGILLEFMVHFVYAYSQSGHVARQERTREALVNVGSTVLCGIVMTKTLGLIVLAFSSALIFRRYYFLFYVGLVPIGAIHGLLFLPAQLSFFGPDLYRRRYDERQQEELAEQEGRHWHSRGPASANRSRHETTDEDVATVHSSRTGSTVVPAPSTVSVGPAPSTVSSSSASKVPPLSPFVEEDELEDIDGIEQPSTRQTTVSAAGRPSSPPPPSSTPWRAIEERIPLMPVTVAIEPEALAGVDIE